MGNSVSPCFQSSRTSPANLIFYEGKSTTLFAGKRVAGEVMFEFPDHMVCHADSFFLGHPIPALSISDELLAGETYFVLPLSCLPSNSILSASSLAAIGSSPNRSTPIDFKGCPFEYIKGSNGRVSIKVLPEFIMKLIARGAGQGDVAGGDGGGFLCSTPELKKQYHQLVGCRDQVWSPKLETISEYKTRFSPCRFIGLECKQKEH